MDAAVSYNRAVRRLYGSGTPWGEVARVADGHDGRLERQQRSTRRRSIAWWGSSSRRAPML
ncbi:MAG: hypothetical protein ACLS3M_13065 [Collinsella sp.]